MQTQLLVWRMPKENPPWGYRESKTSLLKVGVHISESSIRRAQRSLQSGDQAPKRDTRSQFMRNQAASIVACDLFTVESIRMKTVHVLFFIDIHSRRVIIGGVRRVLDEPQPVPLAGLRRSPRGRTDARRSAPA